MAAFNQEELKSQALARAEENKNFFLLRRNSDHMRDEFDVIKINVSLFTELIKFFFNSSLLDFCFFYLFDYP